MSDFKTIYVNARFDAAELEILQRGCEPHELVFAAASNRSNLVATGSDAAAIEAEVLFGQPAIEDILRSQRVRWIALSSAGYTRYDTPAIRDHVRSLNATLTNASGVYDDPCAQHALAMILSLCRQLPRALREQEKHLWNYLPIREGSLLLDDRVTIAIVGFGAIGAKLAALLRPFGCHVQAFRRRPRGDEQVPTHTLDALDAMLPDADIVVNILPEHDSTHHFFDAARLSKLRASAMLINIGRGSTIEQDALVEAASAKRLRAAFLDVTSPEPLPPGHPLWSADNCYITPHTAGGFIGESRRQIEHFLQNLSRFDQGKPLSDVVF